MVDTDAVTFVGLCLGRRADQGDWTRPPDAENVLLISLGSAYTRQPEFYRQCLAAYGGLPDWHVVLQIGKHTDPKITNRCRLQRAQVRAEGGTTRAADLIEDMLALPQGRPGTTPAWASRNHV